MSEENRDEILSNFQACTGMDDVAEALMWLEEAGWDLLTAIKNVVPQDSQTLPSDYVMTNSHGKSSSFHNMSNGAVPVTISDDFLDNATTSDSRALLPLKVHFYDNVININVLDRMKLSDFKTLLYSKTGVPVCSQIITGWDIDLMSNDDEISIANYPSDGKLLLINDQSPGSHKIIPELFTLRIIDASKHKEFRLQLPASRTIKQVKRDVYEITDIEEHDQLWDGWPPHTTDSTMLSEAGLSEPIHTLSVRASAKEKKTVFIDLMDSEDSSPEEYEDASETFTVEDEMFVDELPRRVEPLIPDDVEDEATGAVHFSDAFSRRYGDSRPDFFPGTLEDAIKEACMKPAKERRLLALYLHHDRSVLANVFCTELLCFESVLQTLAAYFVIWGWDITNEANRNKFLASVTQSLGIAVSETISSIQLDNLPALIIITRSRSNTELFTVINGNIGVSELLTLLIHAVDYYGDLQKEEMKEEEERTKREMIKIEQDQAFQQSLLLDRAKEEAKRQQEMLACQEKERLEREKQEKETKRQAERIAIKSMLPTEPPEASGDCTVMIRFRCPGGTTLQRRFLLNQNLEVLFNYLIVEGYRTEEYKVILSWPRRDLTTLSPKLTFNELKLHSQETVTLEER